jgi:hypothetical protein
VIRSIGLAVVLSLLANVASAESFDSAFKKAKDNEATKEGAAYVKSFFERFGPVLRNAMAECFPKGVTPPKDGFNLVLAVTGDGKLSQQMVRPEGGGAQCLLKQVADARVALPPKPDWWMVVEMRFHH